MSLCAVSHTHEGLLLLLGLVYIWRLALHLCWGPPKRSLTAPSLWTLPQMPVVSVPLAAASLCSVLPRVLLWLPEPCPGPLLVHISGRLIDRNKNKKIMFDMLGSKRVGGIQTDTFFHWVDGRKWGGGQKEK